MAVTASFSPSTTQEVADTACRAAGLDPTAASLMRFGENALYRLRTAPIVVRVGRSVEAAHKEVDIAHWLAEHRYPAARLADLEQLEQPQVVSGVPVTFWQAIEESSDPIRPVDVGAMLRALHSLPTPTDFALPPFRPMPKISARLASIGNGLPESDRRFLSETRDRLEHEFSGLAFSLGTGPIHGDYYDANLMRDTSGTVRLIDFEDFAIGPHEWDACMEAIRYVAFGWLDDVEYREFTHTYGFDPLKWAGFPIVRAIRELNMTTWLAQQAGYSAEIDREIQHRISDLRSGQSPRHWRAF